MAVWNMQIGAKKSVGMEQVCRNYQAVNNDAVK